MAIDTIIEDSLSKVEDLASKYLTLEGIIPKVIDKFTTEGNTLRLLNKELGTSSKVSAALRKEMAGLSAATGLAFKSQLELLNVTKEYHQGILASTASTLKFVKASGASADIVGKLSAKLNILGKSSDSAFSTMYKNILAVREELGLTSQQIDRITTLITTYATTVNDIDLDNASNGISAFISRLTTAGLELDDASKFIEDLLNPDIVGEAIPLWSRLGITVSDVIQGDAITKLDTALPRLKSLASEISEMANTNRFAANEMAKVYGLTLSQANQLAKMSLEQSERAEKSLDQYRSEVTTFAESMNNMFTSVGGVLAETVLNPIAKVSSKLSDAINEGGVNIKGAITAGVVFAAGFVYKKIKSLSSRAAKFFDGITDKFNGVINGTSKEMASYARAVGNKAGVKKADIAGINGIKSKEIEAQSKHESGVLSKLTLKSMDIESKFAALYNPKTLMEEYFKAVQEATDIAYNSDYVKNLEQDIKHLQSKEKLSALEQNVLANLNEKYSTITQQQQKLRDTLLSQAKMELFGDDDITKLQNSLDLYEGKSELKQFVIDKYKDAFKKIMPQDMQESLKDVFGSSEAVEAALTSGSKNIEDLFNSLSRYYINITQDSTKTDKEWEAAYKAIDIIDKERSRFKDAEIASLEEIGRQTNDIKTQINEQIKNLKLTPKEFIKRIGSNITQSVLIAKKKIENYVEENGGLGKTALHLAGKGLGKGLGFVGKNIGKFALGGLAAGTGALLSKAKEDPKIQEAFQKVSDMASKLMDTILSDSLINTISNTVEKILPNIESLFAKVGPALAGILQDIAPLIANLAETLMPVVGVVTNIATGIARFILPVFTWIAKAISSVLGFVGRIFGVNKSISESTQETAINTRKTPNTLVDSSNLEVAYLKTITFENGVFKMIQEELEDIKNATKEAAGAANNAATSITEASEASLGN